MWIFGSARKDMLWLHAPGLLAVIVALSFRDALTSTSVLAMIVGLQAVLDAGHVYSTGWRTYFNPRERARTWTYVVLPLALFATFYSLLRSGFTHLPIFFLYAVTFHVLRQYFGISKWYQRLGGVYRKTSDRYLYALCLAPLVLVHFRDTTSFAGMFFDETLRALFPSRLFLGGVALYVVLIGAWIFYEAQLWRRGHRELTRVLSVGAPALVYGANYLSGAGLAGFVFPIALSHAVAYLGLVSLAVERTGSRKRRFGRIAIQVGFAALAFGAFEGIVRANWFSMETPQYSFVTALSLTIVMSHYILDALLWRKGHPEASQIYGGGPSAASALHDSRQVA